MWSPICRTTVAGTGIRPWDSSGEHRSFRIGRHRRQANSESGGQPPHSKRQDLRAYPRTGPLYTMSAMTRFTIAVFLHLVGMVGLFFEIGRASCRERV